MATILNAIEAAAVLRCENSNANMLALLPQVDAYLKQATGRDWSADATIHPVAKAAARMLLVMWFENPGMMSGITNLSFGLTSMLVQLESLAGRYKTFEGLKGAGLIELPGVKEGDSVASLVGVSGATGDQHTLFETVITVDGYIQQLSSNNLEGKFYQACIIPVGAL